MGRWVWVTEHSASCPSSAVHHSAPRCPLLGDPRPRTTSRPGTRREGGTEAAGLRRMGTWDSIPSQPEVPPGLLRHHPLPYRQIGPGSSNTPCLANKPGCAPPPGAQLTAGYQRQDVGARLSGRAEAAWRSPPELLSVGLKLQDPWGKGSQCHSQWHAL